MASDLQEWTVLSMLKWGTAYFKKKELPDPRLSIEWLLAEVLGVKRLDLYLNFERPLTKTELNELRPLVKRRAEHEPLQYITGVSEFLNTRLNVTPDVLIPRMETEQLVEIILERHSAEKPISVLDIGTGSGCIAIALKMERPDWNVTALDIAEEALSITKKNAIRNEAQINLMKGDILNWKRLDFDESADLIVSNPPYVLPEEKDLLEPQVVEYEPSVALLSEDVELMYKSIIQFAGTKLSENGALYLEIHEQQVDSINDLFDPVKWHTLRRKDYADKARFIIGKLRAGS